MKAKYRMRIANARTLFHSHTNDAVQAGGIETTTNRTYYTAHLHRIQIYRIAAIYIF